MSASAPRIETERLVLRPHRVDDLDAASAMWSHPEVVRHIGGKAFSRQDTWSKILRYAGHWALLGFGYWAIESKERSGFVGEIGLADFKRDMVPSIGGIPELGFALSPAVHRKGLAREAARAVLTWADTQFPRTVAIVEEGHAISVRVLAAQGYRRVAGTTYAGAKVELYERVAAGVTRGQGPSEGGARS